jgi:hypothetical protein
MKRGRQLADQGKILSGRKAVTDGPFGESKEVIGDYWFAGPGHARFETQLQRVTKRHLFSAGRACTFACTFLSFKRPGDRGRTDRAVYCRGVGATRPASRCGPLDPHLG